MAGGTPIIARNQAFAEQILNSHLEFVPARKPDTTTSKPSSYILIKPEVKTSQKADGDEDGNNDDNEDLVDKNLDLDTDHDHTEKRNNLPRSPSSSSSSDDNDDDYEDDNDEFTRDTSVLTPISSPEEDDQEDNKEDENDGNSIDKSLSTTTTTSLVRFYDINESTTDKGSLPNSHIVKSWRSLSTPPMGLENRSVTCYMNAAIQAIIHVPAMAHYLMDIVQGKYRNSLPNNSVSNDLAMLLKRLYEPSKKHHVYPIKIIRRLPDINCMMSEWQQEDSHEYFMSLISRIQEDSVPKGQKLNTSIIHEIFGGNIDQKVTCKTCGHISTTHQDFYDLPVSFSGRELKAFRESRELDTVNGNISLSNDSTSLAINSNETVGSSEVSASSSSQNTASITSPVRAKFTLEGSIKDFFSPEIIKPDAKTKSGYQCEKCKNLTSAVKISRINQAPEYLAIHIKRFKFQGSHSQKLKETMRYPLDLDLTKYSVSGEPIRYRLMSVIVHEGRTVSSGHYIALCRQPNNTWAEYDDECVRKVSEKTVLRQNSAYMLIYSRLTHIKKTVPAAKPSPKKITEAARIRQQSKKPSPKLSRASPRPNSTPVKYPSPSPDTSNKRQQLEDDIDQIFNKKKPRAF